MNNCKITFYFINGKAKSIICRKVRKEYIRYILDNGINFLAYDEYKTVVNFKNVCFFEIEEIE